MNFRRTERNQRQLPDFLYKYGSLGGKSEFLKDILLNNRVYAPTIKELNDPREAKPRISRITRKQYDELMAHLVKTEHSMLSPELHTALARKFWEGRSEKDIRLAMCQVLYNEFDLARVYSMSKRYDNLPLWAYYAKNHDGYCLEFCRGGIFAKSRDISYRNEIKISLDDLRQRRDFVIYTKSKEWKHEEEVRLAFGQRTDPYVQFDPTLLVRIIIGQRMWELKQSDANDIAAWAACRTPRLPVFRSEYDTFNQKLRIVSVT